MKTFEEFIREKKAKSIAWLPDEQKMKNYHINLGEAVKLADEWRKLNKHDVMRSLPSEQELIGILKECRDLLVMNTLIDKSGQSKALVDKVDSVMNWQ